MKRLFFILLSLTLVFSLTLTTFAGAVEVDLTPAYVNVFYRTVDHTLYESQYLIYPFSGNNVTGMPVNLYEDSSDPTKITNTNQGIMISFTDAGSKFLLEYGHTYTLSGAFSVSYLDPNTTNSMDFVMATNNATNQMNLPMDVAVYFSEQVRGYQTVISFTIVFEVNEELPPDFSNKFAYPAIDFYCHATNNVSVNFDVRGVKMKVSSEIGEKAFYQANIDALEELNRTTADQTLQINQTGQQIIESNEDVKNAIDNMWENEYEFTSGLMPDTGEAQGGVDDTISGLEASKDAINTLFNAINTTDEEPCIELPTVHFPFIDVTLEGFGGRFYPLQYLAGMNANIVPIITGIKYVVRGIGYVGLVFFTLKQFNFKEWVK